MVRTCLSALALPDADAPIIGELTQASDITWITYVLVDAYEAACQRSVTGALPGYSGSWRRHIVHSAQMLSRAIAEPDYQWSGVAWR